jgi:hypothetical protein
MASALTTGLNAVGGLLQQQFSTLPTANLAFSTYSLSIRYPGCSVSDVCVPVKPAEHSQRLRVDVLYL